MFFHRGKYDFKYMNGVLALIKCRLVILNDIELSFSGMTYLVPVVICPLFGMMPLPILILMFVNCTFDNKT